MRHGHGEIIAMDLPAPSGVVEGAATARGAGRGAEGQQGGEGVDVDVGGVEGDGEEVGWGGGRPGARADWELWGGREGGFFGNW